MVTILIVLTCFKLGFRVKKTFKGGKTHYSLYTLSYHTLPSQCLKKISYNYLPIVWSITTRIMNMLAETLSNRTQPKYFLVPSNGAETYTLLNFMMDTGCMFYVNRLLPSEVCEYVCYTINYLDFTSSFTLI